MRYRGSVLLVRGERETERERARADMTEPEQADDVLCQGYCIKQGTCIIHARPAKEKTKD